jgi:transposase-like protein
MGKVTRKRYSADFKAKVALHALKGEQTLAQLAAKHGVHAVMIANWKRQAIEGWRRRFLARRRLSVGRARLRWRSCTPRSVSWSWNGIFWSGPPVVER